MSTRYFENGKYELFDGNWQLDFEKKDYQYQRANFLEFIIISWYIRYLHHCIVYIMNKQPLKIAFGCRSTENKRDALRKAKRSQGTSNEF